MVVLRFSRKNRWKSEYAVEIERGGSSYDQTRSGGEGERRGMRVIIHCKSKQLIGFKETSADFLPRNSARTRNLDASNNAKVLEL